MILTLAAVAALAARCAPQVAPTTLLAVARTESGLDPLAIGVNGAPGRALHPANAAEAVAVAGRLLAEGRDIDLGLGQINRRNLSPLGLGLAAAFDPCRNLAASGRLLGAAYRREAPVAGREQVALRAALSRYNTGDPVRGLSNGYVTRVAAAAAELVPSLAPDAPPVGAAQRHAAPPRPAVAFTRPPPADVVVF